MPDCSSQWRQTLTTRLRESWRPGDWFTLNDAVVRHYQAKAEVVAKLAPRRAIEIGSRCGYSLIAFNAASPGTRWLAIDGGMDADSEQCLLHWHAVRDRYDISAELIVVNSHAIRDLTDFDFAHVDGDHTYTGCLADLTLVADCRVILADDYDNPHVAAAVDLFAAKNDRRKEVYDDGLRRAAILT